MSRFTKINAGPFFIINVIIVHFIHLQQKVMPFTAFKLSFQLFSRLIYLIDAQGTTVHLRPGESIRLTRPTIGVVGVMGLAVALPGWWSCSQVKDSWSHYSCKTVGHRNYDAVLRNALRSMYIFG